MSAALILDTGPLGLVTNPKLSGESLACYKWLEDMVAQERRIIVPEIADYEIRRELLRANRIRGIRRLEVVTSTLEYLPLTTAAMRQAAAFWAQARQQGQPTAGNDALDGDVILAGQAATLGVPDIIVVTTNVGHLARFVAAKAWRDVS